MGLYLSTIQYDPDPVVKINNYYQLLLQNTRKKHGLKEPDGDYAGWAISENGITVEIAPFYKPWLSKQMIDDKLNAFLKDARQQLEKAGAQNIRTSREYLPP